jgi:hypothetical protein
MHRSLIAVAPRPTPGWGALLALALALALSLDAGAVAAQGLHVRPCVQDATPTSAWILWETTAGAVASELHHFTTPPAREADTSFRMIAVSDMQRDSANPDVYRRVIHDGVLAYLAPEGASRVPGGGHGRRCRGRV